MQQDKVDNLFIYPTLASNFSYPLVLNLILELLDYTRKNLTTCSKSANKPSTSCVRTACLKLSTSLEQAVNNLHVTTLLILSDLLQGCSNRAVTIMI